MKLVQLLKHALFNMRDSRKEQTVSRTVTDTIANFSSVPIRKEPDPDSELLGRCQAGEEFSIVKSLNGYHQVITGNGEIGWIASIFFVSFYRKGWEDQMHGRFI